MAQVATRRATTRKAPQGKPSAAPAPAPRAWQPALIVFALGLAGSLLLYGAFPPLNLPWLAWLAPIPWLWLVRRPELPGKRPYVMLWLAGCVHWLMMEYGIRMAHPALNAGWVALAAYLALYLPVFIGLTRVAVHRLRISIVVAAPVVWVGLELLRGHYLGGFSMGLLAHTQADFPMLIQISDLAGGYTLSFVIMLVAACLTRMIPLRGVGVSPARHANLLNRLWPLAPAVIAIGATLAYGQWRLNQTPPGQSGPAAKIALIQGSLDTVLVVTNERRRETLDQYASLTQQAVGQQQNLDLVVWPESMFVLGEYQLEAGAKPPRQFAGPSEEFPKLVAALQNDFQVVLANMAAKANDNTDPGGSGTHLLVGGNTIVHGPGRLRLYNAALLADREGQIAGRYYKTQAVMFGEYIPVVDWFPWLYDWTPLPAGMSVGDGPRVFDIAGLRMSPSICFESTVPHLIRGQLLELQRQGKPADVLVNLTNDGWFWGSGMLDQHLRCSVFRAVENRKPLVVAANTGISASIDGNGVVQDRGQKRKLKVIITEVHADGRASPYHWLGDWPASVFALACFGLALVGARKPVSRPAGEPKE
jgi:apolipoprotein N-acyltransferase